MAKKLHNKQCAKCKKIKPCIRKMFGLITAWVCSECWKDHILMVQNKSLSRYESQSQSPEEEN